MEFYCFILQQTFGEIIVFFSEIVFYKSFACFSAHHNIRLFSLNCLLSSVFKVASISSGKLRKGPAGEPWKRPKTA